LEGIGADQLNDLARTAETECTISNVISRAVPITLNVAAR
jgi:organic hydroperoxide reductase OsmC/OhrA